MASIEKLWDEVVAGPHPVDCLEDLSKIRALKLTINTDGDQKEMTGKYQRSMSMPRTPSTPTTPGTPRKENVWRSVFHPGSNLNTKTIGAHEYFDKPLPSTPTVYDWLYSEDSRSKYF
ncbi:hypothetical protein Ancab_005177 [Ancistrocladus abbreviatus]